MSTKSPLLPRLRSTAKYSEFKPAALATSKPNFPHSNASNRSLGAISSNQNSSIILFSIAQPYEPLLVYHSSHHTSSSLNLKFSKDSKLLGASYDSSLLIYDCTGEALQPLRQRVSSGTNREHFRSLLWKDATEDGSNELITCTESSISQWDLRTANRKPVITFTCASSISVTYSSHQIGAMAASGVVKVFDDRACNSNEVQSNEKSNFAYEFQAHGTGMGIESSANHWLTWGLDNDMHTSVKIYKQNHSEHTENYWYVENETEDQTDMTPKLEHAKQREQVQCISATNIDKVTAVRSFSHSNSSKEAYGNLPFLTMSMSNIADMSTPSWQADVWSFSSNSNSEKIDPASKIASFCGGGKNDAIAEICGKEYTGSLIAAELSWIPEDMLFEEKEEKSETDGEIVLCCLTNTGYLTTFALPEVDDIDNSARYDEKTPNTGSPFRFISSRSKRDSSTVIFGTSTEKEEATQVKAFNPRIGRKRGKSDADLYTNTSQTIVDLSTVEGGNMQFDLDDEYDDDKNISESQGKEEVELQDKEANNGTTIEEIDPQKASRVPCPRMCSAVFGLNGRLISFHNGNVSNMWNWYTSDFQAQSPSHLQYDMSNQNKVGFRKMEDEHFDKKESEVMFRQMNRIFPRSAWDMMKMNEAAKVAQWGKDLNDDDSDGSRRGSSSSESDGNSSDDSDIDDDSSESDLSDGSEGEAGDMYERYFGIKRSKVDGKVKHPVERKKKGATRARSESFVGPVTANLEPQVFLSDTYQDIAMAGQCSELADSWLLGPYLSEAIPETSTATFDSGKISPRDVFEEWTEDSIEISNHQKMRKSMIGSLHQLYYSESKGDSHVPKAHVPMDQKLMQREHSVRRFETESESKIAPMQIVEPSPIFKPVGGIIHDLRKRRDICLHNARSSISLNEKEKADVWNLIAEIIEGVSDSDAYDDFDGWHSINGNALGQELLLNIFQYYEMMGDVQMLASILSVLKYRRIRQSDTMDCDPLSLYDMLLPHDPLRYDRYIYYYSALLYSWGKLSLRAEMTKHFSDVTVFSGGNQTEKAEGPHQKGIFSPVCQECNARANSDTNICGNCHRYAFKCSICTNVVRGLFTVCVLCGHGGHMAHLMPWFLERSDCPTGCGCNCSFNNFEIST